VSGQTFGLAFFRMSETERQRLGQVLTDESARVKEIRERNIVQTEGRLLSDLGH
jgi:hypothetical protein